MDLDVEDSGAGEDVQVDDHLLGVNEDDDGGEGGDHNIDDDDDYDMMST